MRLLSMLSVLLFASASSWSYEYPINDPYLATVMGTPEPLQADLPDKMKLKIRQLPKTSAWQIPQSDVVFRKAEILLTAS